MNELLHDVAVCEIRHTHEKGLAYVGAALWQVESEFAQDSGAVLIDFSKLTLGSAQNKLFIASPFTDHEAQMSLLHQAAATCTGRVYLALVPHPDEWSADPAKRAGLKRIRLWQYAPEGWREVDAPTAV